MSITVNFRTASGTNQTRIFQRREGVSVFGKVTGLLGLGEPFTHMRLEIPEISFFAETRCNVFGDYDFFFRMPGTGSGVLTLRITATFTASGQDIVVIPVAYGEEKVPPTPPPPLQGDIAYSVGSAIVTPIVVVAGVYLLIRYLFTKVERTS